MESFYQDKRVLQDFIPSNNKVTNHDATLIFGHHDQFPTSDDRFVTYNFHTKLSFIVRCYGYTVDDFISKIDVSRDVSTFTKNLTVGEDGNYSGYTTEPRLNLIYLPEDELSKITKITCTSSSGGGLHTNVLFKLYKSLPNLKELDLKTNTNMGRTRDVDFLNFTPNLKILKYRGFAGIALKNHSSLKYVDIANADIPSFIENIPNNVECILLNYVLENNIDLEKIFKGSVKSLTMSKSNAQAGLTINYNGGAIFPSIITNTDSDFNLGPILSWTITDQNKGNLNGSVLSQFLIDFANQVTSVDLPTAQKLIRLRGLTPNTSHEDLSQPLFTTYASALTYITNTLGVTVQFT